MVFSFKDVSLHLHGAFSYRKYTNTALVNVVWSKNNMITMITSKILGRPMDPMAYFQSHMTMIFLHHPLQQGANPQL